jgi:hypothetical protein
MAAPAETARINKVLPGELDDMEHDEFYHGQRFVVTTAQQAAGTWVWKAELVDASGRTPLGPSSDFSYPSEEAALRAARSAAAAAIDATRILKGKP